MDERITGRKSERNKENQKKTERDRIMSRKTKMNERIRIRRRVKRNKENQMSEEKKSRMKIDYSKKKI